MVGGVWGGSGGVGGGGSGGGVGGGVGGGGGGQFAGVEPVQLSVVFSYVAERECRVPAAREACVPFVDQINRALSLTLDTRVGDLQLGLQGTWTDRRSFIGQRQGATLFQLGLFGQFLIEAGALDRLGLAGLGG